MAKLVSCKEPVRLEPADQAGRPEGERVAYWVRPPSLYDRTAFARAVLERGGRRHGAAALLAQLKRGIEAALTGDDQAEARENLLARVAAALEDTRAFQQELLAGRFDGEDGLVAFQAAAESLRAHDEGLAEIADVVAELDARYARMRADEQLYASIAAVEAARLFLAGWDNMGPFRRGPQGVPAELLERIPPLHLLAIGGEVERLLRPSEAERKNSDSPSPSPSAAASSMAANPPTAIIH